MRCGVSGASMTSVGNSNKRRCAMQVSPLDDGLQDEPAPMYLGDTFDRRVLLEMELALSKACEALPAALNHHANRTLIASRIIQRVENGERTFGGLVTAGLGAVWELRRDHRKISTSAHVAPFRPQQGEAT